MSARNGAMLTLLLLFLTCNPVSALGNSCSRAAISHVSESGDILETAEEFLCIANGTAVRTASLLEEAV